MIEPMIHAAPRLILGMLFLAAGLAAFQENGAILDTTSRAKRPDSTSSIPVLTVCEALGDRARYNGTLIIVVGRFGFTDEGTWLDEECGLKLVINGRSFTPNISTTYSADDFAPAPQKPIGFKWDRVLLASKLRAVKSTTQLRVVKQYHYTDQWMAILGRLEADLPRHRTIRQQQVIIDGYGHLNGSPAQLIPANDGYLRLNSK